MRALRILTLGVVPVSAAALLAGGCSKDEPEQPAESSRASFYSQQVAWAPCAEGETSSWFPEVADNRTCARVLAPLDYRAPAAPSPDSAGTVSLAVARLPATAQKRGTLVLISGGPGDPGLGMLDMPFPEPIREQYDIVAYDPRGVGRSTPAIVCDSDGEDLTEEQESVAATENARRRFVASCARGTGPDVLRHIGSDEATDDLDILRGVFGEQQLNLLAASYGTQVAAMYVHRYPHGYRAAALDGVVDVTEDYTQMRVGQGKGYQDTFNRVAAFCAERYRAECPLGTDPAQAENVFRDILRTVKLHPAPAGEAAPVEPGDILQAISTSYLWPTGWAPFLDALTAVRGGDGTAMRKLANAAPDEPPRQAPSAKDTEDNALTAITCADVAEPTADRATRQADEAALYDAATYDDYEPRPAEFPLDTCDFWPTPGTAKAFRPHRAEGAAPVLFIGTRHDPTTPVGNAERMAGYLDSPLLIREGDGHTFVFGDVNRCIDDRVVAYFEDPASAHSAVCAAEPER
ncbi:putative carboxylesterase [Nocardia brasiliensis NBRC 14402]|uniref:alpha/beta hydrolase n=1 Tax=Nocardia brasiliensis TaxID=37326 RepID=UPI0002EF3FEA|nr:alpha/beta hydrolase [Nocardia brasiliensis]ASF06864.1 alpha/beta hydrolase [Nocardia brasiliensis]GAJ82224.1 putative carboxylesterase [Nocardia brasiliensis NBRC 14402]SUB47921.1 Tripeptidyl aminopeptidase precursor [Nocardia brasiliensis]